MSQSEIEQVINVIRVNWTLKWAEQNAALVRCPDEAWMRHIQEKDWRLSNEHDFIKHALNLDMSGDTRLKVLKAIETTCRLAPQWLSREEQGEDDDEDDDEYESDYGETDTEDEENDDPLPPAQHIILDTVMDEDPMN